MMHEDRFDQAAKALAATSHRRDFLKLAASTAAGGVLALLAATGASAMEAPTTQTSHGKKCPAGMFACGKNCCDGGGDVVCHNGMCCLPPRCY